MNLKDRELLILNGVAKPHEQFVLTKDELPSMFEGGKTPRVYVGYEPSGPVHLGNLLQIEKLADLAAAGMQPVVLLADLHGFLNKKGPMPVVRAAAESYWRTVFRSLYQGERQLDIILGSTYQLTPEYILDALALCDRTPIRTAWKAMSMIARKAESVSVAQHIYPVMQALDPLYLECRAAFGGTDQLHIHVHARELFGSAETKLNHPTWVPFCFHLPLLPGLTSSGKMSSSNPDSHIAAHDPPEVIAQKCASAFCPPPSEVAAGVANPTLEYLEHVVFPFSGRFVVEHRGGRTATFTAAKELQAAYLQGEIHPADLKASFATWLTDRFRPARQAFERCPELLKPLWDLQKWQFESGLLAPEAWSKLQKSYVPYLGGST